MLGVAMSTLPQVATTADRVGCEEATAVAELYDLHHEAVRSFARRLTGDPAAAEDLVHDVFLRVPGALRRHRGEASLRTVLVSIAINVARKHVRSAARHRAALARAVAGGIETAPSPEEDLERRQVAMALHAALDALPLKQRVAFVLLEIEERSYAEAATIACVPEATMRTRLFHAKRRLRVLLHKRGIL